MPVFTECVVQLMALVMVTDGSIVIVLEAIGSQRVLYFAICCLEKLQTVE